MGIFWLIFFVGTSGTSGTFGTFGTFGPVWANVVAMLFAGFLAFILHRYLTFRVTEIVAMQGQAFRYFLFIALNLPLASVILALFLLWFPDLFVAKYISDVICIGLTFLVSKHLIFARRKNFLENAEPIEASL